MASQAASASTSSLTSSGSTASSFTSPRTPDGGFEVYGTSDKSIVERINTIADFITVQEQCAAELHSRLAQLTQRVTELAYRLQDANSTPATSTLPRLLSHASVLYPPQFGVPTTKSRCQMLARQRGMAKLDIPSYVPPRPHRARGFAAVRLSRIDVKSWSRP
ncbi:hypothetical protein BST61_g4617 [Cercospora zeina]